MTQRTASMWPDADLTGCGLPGPGTDLANLPTACVVGAIAATKNGHCFLDWQLFQFALSMHSRVRASSTNVVATQKSILDLESQTALELQMSLESTEYAARVLLLDAFDARDRLPRVYATMRLGLIDRDRFHRIAHETRLVVDEDIMAKIDALIAAEILGAQRGYTCISVTKTGAMARRHVAEQDPDAARREREGAKDGRSLGHQALEAGMAQLFLTATAEDVRLARQMLDAVIAGRCPADPRTKTQARSDAAIALLQRKQFTCACDSEGCTAAISDVELDARAARIVVHVLCDATTLEGGDKCGYLDGHGPISAEHVREIANRGDAVIHQHRLDDLLEASPADGRSAHEHPDEAALHRRAPRSETPDERRGDDSRPETENGGEPAAVIAKTSLPSDPYRPNLLTDLIARFLWGTCSIPGCERAAFACDLDHVAEFDNVRPDLGGPTCVCNLLPKCRYHHLVKTNLEGFVDDLWIDSSGRYHSSVTTPMGQTVEVLAPNQWLIPRLADLRCTHQLAGQHATGIASGTVAEGPQRARTRTAAKHARRRAERRANHDRRLAELSELPEQLPEPEPEPAVDDEYDACDEPPF
ncbi:DUF222 domain-containing protein [Gordonia phosphorivorans]|uniref:DUF222 domain-containing protein n=1 Tax=Gordonia phosphorivorans TaxID=1056982 RepID=A0ABV6HAL1_9ACTN